MKGGQRGVPAHSICENCTRTTIDAQSAKNPRAKWAWAHLLGERAVGRAGNVDRTVASSETGLIDCRTPLRKRVYSPGGVPTLVVSDPSAPLLSSPTSRRVLILGVFYSAAALACTSSQDNATPH